jgi:hypothetical protein
MVRKRRLISVVMVVTFLVFMGMAATAFPQQRETGRPGPAGTSQPGVAAQPGAVVKPGMVAQPSVGKEDCISFNPATMTVQQIKGQWCVADPKGMAVRVFRDKAVADRSLAIIQHYGMNQQCFVGRGNREFLQYNLVSGVAPVGPFAGECCLPFNLATTTVQQAQGQWKVTDGKQWMFSYPNEALADQAVAIIKKYGFTHLCYVLDRPGGAKVPFSLYLRK